jgi:HEAT repeat protein
MRLNGWPVLRRGNATRLSIALAILAASSASGFARDTRGVPHLVRFTAERSTLVTGGHLSPGCHTVLTAETAQGSEEVTIRFSIAEGTGMGRTTPAMISATEVATNADRIARTFLLSSDAEEECRVRAEVGGGASLELRFEMCHTVVEQIVVAPTSTASEPQREPIDAMVSALASQLADPAVEVRTAVKRRLVAMGGEAVIALVAVAGDPKVARDTRSLAARTLAEMRDEEADDQLLALLAHPLPDVRSGAEDAVAMMLGERALPLAGAALLSENASVRASGVRMLVRLANSDADRAALAAIDDADPFVRSTVVWELSRTQSPAAEEAVRRGLEDGNPFVRVIAAKSVVLLGTRPTVLYASLVELLDDGDVGVRSAAARALGVLEDGRETALTAVMADPDARVRRSVALALPWRADAFSSLRLLRQLVDDADPVVRETALRAIAESGTEAEIDLFLRALSSDDDGLRALAARTLRRITCLDFGWTRAVDERARQTARQHWEDWYESNKSKTRHAWLWQALDLPGSSLRGEAGRQLARAMPMGPDGAKDALAAALARILESAVQADEYAERHAAAEALMLLGRPAGIEELKSSLASPRQYVRLSSVKAIASALSSGAGHSTEDGGREALRALIAALEDGSVSVRRIAARALQAATGRTFGYESQAPAKHRAAAVVEWRRWFDDAATAPGDHR